MRILITLLILSFSLNSAFAKAEKKKEEEVVKEKTPEENKFSCDNLDPDLAKFTSSEIVVLKRLKDRKKRLLEWEDEIIQKEQMLSVIEDRIDRKIQELKTLKKELEAQLKVYEQEDKQKMLSIAKIYETMKPTDAAKVFETMSIKSIMEILPLMKEAKVAQIFEKMSKEKAKKVSIAYANFGRLESDKLKDD